MRTFLFAVLALSLALPAGMNAAKRQRFDSQWRERDIAIDGDSGDWVGPLHALDEKHPITAAVANDAHFLYLVLSTGDPVARRQILRQGLIVWFDPGGGDKKHFGIKFPVGFTPGASGGRGGYRRPSAGGGPPADPDSVPAGGPDRMELPNWLEVYGPVKDDVHNFVVDMAPGIAVKVGQVEGYLVYELKVPLATSGEMPYAIEVKPGGLIGLGLETPKFERPSRERRGGGFGGGMGGRGGGGMGGRGGGMGGRGGGMGGRRDSGFEELKPWKVWANVQLAAR